MISQSLNTLKIKRRTFYVRGKTPSSKNDQFIDSTQDQDNSCCRGGRLETLAAATELSHPRKT